MTKRPWLLSAAVALVTILVGVVAVLALAAGGDSNGDAAAAQKRRTGQKSDHAVGARDSTRTTTTTPAPTDSTTTTTAVGGPATGAPPPGAPATNPPQVQSAFDQTDPPDPADAYEPQPYPPGVTSTITSCRWSPANGGQVEASGVLTNSAGEDDDWLFSAVWLWHNVNQNEDFAQQDTVIHAEVGQAVPWHLTIGAPTQPPNVSCALEID